jgi:hypothetical protein
MTAGRAHPIARVRLARSVPRLLALPFMAVLLGVAGAAGAIVLVGSTAGLLLAAAGALLAIAGGTLGAYLLSVRVHVEESLVRVSSLFGRRVYLLTPGSLVRVHLRGEGASRLRARWGVGWALGRAVLRDEEDIHVVRLAPTPTVILVPTASGRLAIATSNEPHLIDALTRAARARAARAELLVPEPVAPVPPAPPEPAPRPERDVQLMTGIERAEYEARLAQLAARASAAAPEGSAPAATPAMPVRPAAVSATAAPDRRRLLRAPSWARRRPSTPSMPSLPSMPTVAVPAIPMPRVPQRVRDLPVSRPRPSWLVPLIPLAGAAAAWAIGLTIGEMPATGSDDSRLTVLALVLAGPATTVGAIMARTWWPRISGVVVTGGLLASIFIGRALLGA